MNIRDLIAAAGSPLDTSGLWDGETHNLIVTLAEDAIDEARRRWPAESNKAVAEVLLGLYGHGFMVGRDHARLGLILPGTARRGLNGMTLDDLPSLIIPNDIRDL